jgi:hypothetical protein
MLAPYGSAQSAGTFIVPHCTWLSSGQAAHVIFEGDAAGEGDKGDKGGGVDEGDKGGGVDEGDEGGGADEGGGVGGVDEGDKAGGIDKGGEADGDGESDGAGDVAGGGDCAGDGGGAGAAWAGVTPYAARRRVARIAKARRTPSSALRSGRAARPPSSGQSRSGIWRMGEVRRTVAP